MVGKSRVPQEVRGTPFLGGEAFVRVAHDLRNPLAPIRTAVQLLRMLQADPGRSKELLDLIERQVGHLVRLIDRITEYGELEPGRETPVVELVQLALAIDEAVGNSSAVIGAAGHRLELSLPERALTTMGDPRRLAQAFAYVIENAAKFQASGGVIEVSLREERDQGVVRVRDQGFGMSEAAIAGLYRPFVRGHTASPHLPTGLGLGLALARAIIERHGGSIEVASPGEGQGTEVTIRVPLSP
jgi:signal transduction histidine kinase